MTAKSAPALDLLTSLFLGLRAELLAFVSRRAGPQEAEDIVQDTWLHLHRHAQAHDQDAAAAPPAWRDARAVAFATAGHLSVDHWRRRQVRQALPLDAAGVDEVICPRPGPDTVVDARRQAQGIAQALDELPPPCREAFLLNRLDGLTHAEIAARLGVSSKTVQRHIERALSHCMARLP